MADKKRRSEGAIMADVLRGVAEAISYTEEEIRDTLSPEDAEEFIALREELCSKWENTYDDEKFTEAIRKLYRERIAPKSKSSLAAEEGAHYNAPQEQ